MSARGSGDRVRRTSRRLMAPAGTSSAQSGGPTITLLAQEVLRPGLDRT